MAASPPQACHTGLACPTADHAAPGGDGITASTTLWVLAHGLGEGAALPVPFPLVLLVSAGSLVGVAGRLSSAGDALPDGYEGSRSADAATGVGRWQTALLRASGLVITTGLLGLAVLGPEDPAFNPAHQLAFGLLWPLLVPFAALLGGFTRLLSPLRTLGGGLLRLVDPDGSGVAELPPAWGVWPATTGLLLIVWMDVVGPASPKLLAFAVAVYVLGHLAATMRYGPAWLSRGESLEVVADLAGRLSPLGRRPDGRLTLRSPRRSLAAPAAPGMLAVLAVLIGGHLFDFVADTGRWTALESMRQGLSLYVVRTAGLLGCIAVVALLAVAATRVRVLVAALVPLVVGYALAHHTPVLLVEGQVALRQLAEPGIRAVADYEVLPVVPVAVFMLLAFVATHLLALRTAHDLAFARYDPRGARAVQFPLRAVLLLSLTGGLALRFLG